MQDNEVCGKTEEGLIIALLVITALVNFCLPFTDTYTDGNNRAHNVFIVPWYGPVTGDLPTEQDKDLVYEHYYVKLRDVAAGLISSTTFVLLTLFTNPLATCLFPTVDAAAEPEEGTSSLAASVVRTIPLLVSIFMALLMTFIGPPRQMIGYQNAPSTVRHLPPADMRENPMYGPQNPEGGAPPQNPEYSPGLHSEPTSGAMFDRNSDKQFLAQYGNSFPRGEDNLGPQSGQLGPPSHGAQGLMSGPLSGNMYGLQYDATAGVSVPRHR